MKDNELIVCRDVSLGYEGKSVLTDLNLTIAKGDYLCVVGDNGSGKSTLMRGLLGLIQPQSGTIHEHAPALKHGATATFLSRPGPADFPATVLEVVLSGCLNRQGLHFFYTPAQRSEAHDEPGQAGDSGAEGRLLPGSLRVGSSSGCYWPAPCAPPASF